MRGVAGRLDDEAAKIEIARKLARCDPLFEQPPTRDWKSAKTFILSVKLFEERASNASPASPSKRRACSWIAKRSVIPAI